MRALSRAEARPSCLPALRLVRGPGGGRDRAGHPGRRPALTTMRIAVDAMGGDHAPREIVRGAIDYASTSTDEVMLVGDVPRLEREIAAYARGTPRNVRLVDAPEVIGMNDHPATA